MKTKIEYGIKKVNNKFIVTKNNEPVIKSASTYVVTEFDSKEDANKYISILKSLKQS